MTDLPRRIRGTINATVHLATLTQLRLTPLLDHLAHELDELDGYPTTASGSDSGSHSPYIPAGEHASTSSTERTALARHDNHPTQPGPHTVLEELYEHAQIAARALEIILRECDARTPGLSSVTLSQIRCPHMDRVARTNNLPGFLEIRCSSYTDPTRNDGLCCDHGRTHDTARRSDLLARRALRDRIRYHHTNGTT